MNGADHYREAERLLDGAKLDDGHYGYRDSYRPDLTAAQIHATLALAAATTLSTAHEFYEIADDVEAWAEVTDAAVLDEDQAGDLDQEEARLGRSIVDVQLPESVRLCIDADCPQCGWGERWFEPDRQLFGCAKCDYTSKERAA